MVLGLQIIGFAFALLMVYMSIIHYKKGSLTGVEIISWVTIWSVVIFAVLFPEILRTYSETFAVSRLFDLLIVGAFIVVIVMTSTLYVKIKDLEKKIEKLVRGNALKGAKMK